MEHDPGSGAGPALASSMPDQRPAAQPSEAGGFAEAGKPGAVTAGSGEGSGPAGQAEADESAAEPTREPRVDAAVSGLDELRELPVAEHPAVYERIHEQLVEVLGELHPGTQSR